MRTAGRLFRVLISRSQGRTAIGFLALVLAAVLAQAVLVPSRAAGFAQAAAGPVVLTNEQGKYPLGLHMDILEDPTAKETIQDVSSPAFDARFAPSRVEEPVYGYTNSAYWVRLVVDNETSQTNDWVLEVDFANTHYVDLYTHLPNGQGYSVKQSGLLRPVSTRDNVYPRIVFNLNIPPHARQSYYLRFQNGNSMTLGLTLWSMQAFMTHAQQELLFYGVLFGALLALLVYHLFLLLTLRDISYLYFVTLLACLLLTLLVYQGYMAAFLLPNVYFMSLYAFPLTNAGVYISIGLFSATFLELKTLHPKLYWANIGVVGIWGLLVLLSFIISYRDVAAFMVTWALISLGVVLVSGVASWLKGYQPAAIFMLSWLALVVSLLLLESVRIGILPGSFLAENAFQPAFILMAIGWSIALADRINVFKSRMEAANLALKNSERRLAQILDGLPFGVVGYGQDQKPRYMNRRVSEILGNTEAGIRPDVRAGRTLAQAVDYYGYKIAGTNVRYPVEKTPIYRALQGIPASIDDLEANIGGRCIPLEIWASPVLDSAGMVETAVATMQDITQRKQAEAELAAYRKQLESLVEARTAELNAANKELRLRLEWLAAVNLVNQILERSADFEEIFGNIIEIINRLFSPQDAFIAELDGNGSQLKILAHSCQNTIHPDLIGSFTNLPAFFLPDSNQGELVFLSKEQVSQLDGPLGVHIRVSGEKGMVLVPLQLRGQMLGFLGLEREVEGGAITSEEANLLHIFSTDIAQIMENARLFEQAKLLIATEERNRLARELHDSVAQALFSISLYSDASRRALTTNRLEAVRENLDELAQLSREALADMRLLIFELRPPVLEESGLVAALQARLDSVESRAGFHTHLEIEGEFQLTQAQEGELYRIAQEALNNVLKHAHAEHVVVTLKGEPDRFRMTIEDNGVGFDLRTAEQAGGQGLRSIRERAEKIGAAVFIEPKTGHGVKIIVEVNQ